MKLAYKTAKLLAGVAVTACLVSGAWGQAAPAKKTTHKKNPAPAAKAAPDASAAAKPVIAESGKRDPFQPLVNENKASGPPLPPGKAGLVVATVHVDGTVSSPNGMLAVVSNPDQRVYFLREGDRLYDGDVEKIGLDGVTFKENSKDAFGKQVERTVTKRIYPSAGEQQ
jgi:Tfp pilus assembly protein PilP